MTAGKRAIALGCFDGVHLGHGELLKKTRQRAQEIGGFASVLSFDVHPDTLVLNREVPLINSAIDRQNIIKDYYGIDNVVFIHFNRRVMQMQWTEFIENLIQELDIGWIVVGHDFCFGYKGEGTAGRLAEYCLTHNIGCDIIPALSIDGIVVSSTHIRGLISAGEMEQANRFLGHPHVLSDTVHSGYHLGTKMGTPTINMFFPEGVLVPKFGVYASRVYLDDGEICCAVTNVGVRPTVDSSQRVSVESFLLNYSGNLYGRQAKLELLTFMRPEIQFSNVEELGNQIKKDAANAALFFAAAQKQEKDRQRN